jgi:hypothetical protein
VPCGLPLLAAAIFVYAGIVAQFLSAIMLRNGRYCCIQGARSEHNGLCDRRATKKTAKKTLICSSYLLYVPYLSLGYFRTAFSKLVERGEMIVKEQDYQLIEQ